MSISLSRILLGLVFVTSTAAFSPRLYADDPVMPSDAEFDRNPAAKGSIIETKLFVYGWDRPFEAGGERIAIPTKLVTMVNYNTTQTIYPIMRSPNSAKCAWNPAIGLYDPFDPVEKEYRGYVGYKDSTGKYRFGLPPGKSITFRVPLVFWDGSRTGMLTTAAFVAPKPGELNPYEYDNNAKKVIVAADDSTPDGVVMWYRAETALAPSNESPDQLIEWAIRDRYLGTKNISAWTKNELPKNQILNLIDYDVSYVDTLFLPVAMEALNATALDGSGVPRPYGWTGSTDTFAGLQEKIKKFTSPGNSYLGSYFGPKQQGWPQFYFPKSVQGVKIPSGAKLFELSPLSGDRSKFDSSRFALSSSGNGPVIFASIGAAGDVDASSGFKLYLTPNVDKATLDKLPGLFVSVDAGDLPPKDNPIPPDTKVVRVDSYTTGITPNVLVLSKQLKASQKNMTFSFRKPATDYAADAIAKLWFSWADVYLKATKDTRERTVTATVKKNKAVLTFQEPQSGLVVGMQVRGKGLPDPDPAMAKGGVIILQILSKKSVVLSQLAASDQTGQYEFLKPQPLPTTPQDLHVLKFDNDPKDPARVPAEFAKQVYLAMASIAQIGKSSNPNVKAPPRVQFMTNLIGGNTGFMFEDSVKDTPDAAGLVGATVRDIIKSLLRGVTDFSRFPERGARNQFIWYPKPTLPRGGLPFNAYNLDPFVYFVHVELGNTGYGFSLDDDKANVGAGDATKLLVAYSGVPKSPPYNDKMYTPATPFGPLNCTANWDPNTTARTFLNITNASNTTPIMITTPTAGLRNGDTVRVQEVKGNTAANGTWKITNVTPNSFTLVDSKGNGNYQGGGKWDDGPHPCISNVDIDKVFSRIRGDEPSGAFQGPIVTGPGVKTAGAVRVIRLGDRSKGQLLLSAPLTKDDGTPLEKGPYTWKLTGY